MPDLFKGVLNLKIKEPPLPDANDLGEARRLLTIISKANLQDKPFMLYSELLNRAIGNVNYQKLPRDIKRLLAEIYGYPSITPGQLRVGSNKNEDIYFCSKAEKQHKPRVIIKGVGWGLDGGWTIGYTDILIVGKKGGIIFPGVLAIIRFTQFQARRSPVSQRPSGSQFFFFPERTSYSE